MKKDVGFVEERDSIENGGRMVLNREGTMGETISEGQVARIAGGGGARVAPINGPAME